MENVHREECLLVIGVRQKGKKYIIRDIAKNNYTKYYEFIFLTNPKFKSIFDSVLGSETIIRKMSLMEKEFSIILGQTLMFFDKI